MANESKNERESKVTRRGFLKTSAVAAGAVVASGIRLPSAYAAPSDTLKIGLIGCGGRGTGALQNCLDSNEGVAVHALGDLFPDRVNGAFGRYSKYKDKGKVDLDKSRCFVGFDAYQKVLATDVDLVILATPPGFRPDHFAAAIKAGKHVFMEKPVAVDPVGIRKVFAASDEAKKKGLGVVAGTQRRHEAQYVGVMEQIRQGAIGEVVSGQCYWNQGGLWVRRRNDKQSDMEWQCRNWLYFAWLSGDHIVEQHVHNIDVINWAVGTHPVKIVGMGGREVRTGPEFGNIFDHFAIEFEFPNRVRVLSMCRQTPGCANRVTEFVHGTKGWTQPGTGEIIDLKGKRIYKYEGPRRNPYEQEHMDLIKSIRDGKPLNEGRQVAESTLCAIAGRMSAYTGREISWKWVAESSKLDLVPKKLELGDLPARPVAIPGNKDSWKVWWA